MGVFKFSYVLIFLIIRGGISKGEGVSSPRLKKRKNQENILYEIEFIFKLFEFYTPLIKIF